MERETKDITVEQYANPANFSKGRTKAIEYVVIHYVGAEGGAKNNADYFKNNQKAGASAHYFVGHASENGIIYKSVKDCNTAWHCGANSYKHKSCRNNNSIGVELCCHKDNTGKWYFDKITMENAQALTRDLCRDYDINKKNIVRHFDVTGKICPEPYVSDEQEWQKFLNGCDIEIVASGCRAFASLWSKIRRFFEQWI